MSRIRADQILNGAGTGAPNFAQGLQVGAATTIHTTGIDLGSGNIQSHNLNSTGVITATSGLNVTAGNVLIGNTDATLANADADELVIGGTTGSHGLTIVSQADSNQTGNIFWSDGTSSSEHHQGAILYNHTSNHMAFMTDGYNERLRISSGGQVTKPSNAAFRAQGNTQYPNQTSDLDLVYDNEIFDAGGNFDPSTGRFTAPVDGKYFFYFQYLTYPDTDPAYKTLQFKVNGTASYNNGFFRIKNSTQDSPAVSALMDLSANDWVIPHVTIPSVGSYDFYMINGHAHFFGYLVS